MLRKSEQQRFLGAEVIENTSQKFRLGRGTTKLLWGNARGHQEAVEAPLIFGQKCQSLNGQQLGVLPVFLSARAFSRVKRPSLPDDRTVSPATIPHAEQAFRKKSTMRMSPDRTGF